jgi:hypothetical protein
MQSRLKPGRRSIGHSYSVTVSMYLVSKPTDSENRSTALVRRTLSPAALCRHRQVAQALAIFQDVLVTASRLEARASKPFRKRSATARAHQSTRPRTPQFGIRAHACTVISIPTGPRRRVFRHGIPQAPRAKKSGTPKSQLVQGRLARKPCQINNITY